MPDLGRQLIAACLADKAALAMLIEAGFGTAWMTDTDDLSRAAIFGDETDREAYRALLEYWQRNQSPPPLSWFRSSYPALRLPSGLPPAAELLRQAQQDRLRVRLEVFGAEFAALHDKRDYAAAARLMLARGQQLASQQSALVRITLDSESYDLRAKLERRQRRGIPVGIAELDSQFAGWQPGQLVTFLGRAKAAKTSHLIKAAIAAHQAGRRVLFVSVEVTADSIADRCDAFAAGVEYEDYAQGTLSDRQKKRILAAAEERSTEGDFEIIQPQARFTLDDLEAEVARFRPHAVYIDGFYFLTDRITGKPGGNWEGHDNLARELKELALRHGLVVITTMQIREKQARGARRGSFDDNTMMGGTGLIMASDMVLTLDMDEDQINTITCSRSRTRYLRTVRGRWTWPSSAFEVIEEHDDQAAAGPR